jgi:hypothetical protein
MLARYPPEFFGCLRLHFADDVGADCEACTRASVRARQVGACGPTHVACAMIAERLPVIEYPTLPRGFFSVRISRRLRRPK